MTSIAIGKLQARESYLYWDRQKTAVYDCGARCFTIYMNVIQLSTELSVGNAVLLIPSTIFAQLRMKKVDLNHSYEDITENE